jgi:glycosyltransferase involved in cell wall biosynthesis
VTLVSVVVPTHNRAGLVRRAVDSVLAQTVDDLEVIVVDDGSSDVTPSVLAELAASDRRVRAVRHDEPAGPPAARNRGIDEARGRFVAFLDDDDEWLPMKLERQLAAMDDDGALVLVSCHHALVGDDGSELPYRGPTACTRGQLLWCDFLGGSSLGLVRRGAFPDGVLPRFDGALRTCQDWDYWVRCAEVGAVALVPEVLPLRRRRRRPADERPGEAPRRAPPVRRQARRVHVVQLPRLPRRASVDARRRRPAR